MHTVEQDGFDTFIAGKIQHLARVQQRHHFTDKFTLVKDNFQ